MLKLLPRHSDYLFSYQYTANWDLYHASPRRWHGQQLSNRPNFSTGELVGCKILPEQQFHKQQCLWQGLQNSSEISKSEIIWQPVIVISKCLKTDWANRDHVSFAVYLSTLGSKIH